MAADQWRLVERRRLERADARERGAISARVRPGHHAEVLNISADGAQIDTAYRLRPGTMVDLQIDMSAYRAQARARVVHAAVSELDAERVRYRAGLAFERALNGPSRSEADLSSDVSE